MALELTSLRDLAAQGFDDIIDVRSPAEHAEDHLPGAINLPVMDNAERARVGTIYKQVSPFMARKIGAAIVARNAARHLEGPLADKPGGWRPLVYCWRGGQRSGSFATILSQIGWRVELVRGGYKAWRGLVVQALYDRPFPAPVIVLDGNTGSAKTELLNLLPEHGVQVIDLEGLAGHRGSLFGAMGVQPSQKLFEMRLAMAMSALDPARPVVVEAESAKVGECRLPPGLWRAMCAAPRIEIAAPLAARAAYLTRAYADLTADPDQLLARIESLRHFHSAETIETWMQAARAGDFATLAQGLMAAHYDPRYNRHRARIGAPATVLPAPGLAPGDLAGLARDLAREIASR
ncbi:tRNA 2-selenouridine(34) synthase MnmH [Phaeovulum vinaykumarii]|uniref:tRNA 2-selenouridine synthase n=1 Tax=Phaeovulum vinaykumarii TaxID=407234 RepID=A0A1N7LX57_9RHOB|nr:tRNA 2-selenouridine(34) synthase MnmH [Phaeovulum vinaykumarii]SIS78407.1 tRNA 2-selenouridine synthase [Phaeovulum vinaykumarii]SOC07041.1 tRNA 2-selenouridine synthase [Phaeovulum vinaykumarii]